MFAVNYGGHCCIESPGSDRLSLEEMDAIAHISQTLSSPAEIEARKSRLVAMLRSVSEANPMLPYLICKCND